jgi:heme o synthase
MSNIAIPNSTSSSSQRSRVVDFYELTKPRMNFLVVTTTAVGFFMVAKPGIDWMLLVHTILGTVLTASSAAVLNQLIERQYDALMPRTRNRPIPAGRISLLEASAFGIVLGLVGIGYLATFVNTLTAMLGAFTLLSYIFVYTPAKRITTLNTVIGAIPGAVPAMMGATAIEGQVSMMGIAMFAILFFWQMPHFLAIAILYRNDYALGGFKMLPVVDESLTITSRQILLYGMALIPVSLMPYMLGATGVIYFTFAVLMGLAFLSFGISCATTRTRRDARGLFFASIIYLPLLMGVMMIDKM